MNGYKLKILAFIILAISMLVIAGIAIPAISNSLDYGSNMHANSTRDVIITSAIECYALEGAYPISLEYINVNYGVIIDYDTYNYYYEYNGVNLRPNVKVVKK